MKTETDCGGGGECGGRHRAAAEMERTAPAGPCLREESSLAPRERPGRPAARAPTGAGRPQAPSPVGRWAAPSHTWAASGTQGAASDRVAPAAASLGPERAAVEDEGDKAHLAQEQNHTLTREDQAWVTRMHVRPRNLPAGTSAVLETLESAAELS